MLCSCLQSVSGVLPIFESSDTRSLTLYRIFDFSWNRMSYAECLLDQVCHDLDFISPTFNISLIRQWCVSLDRKSSASWKNRRLHHLQSWDFGMISICSHSFESNRIRSKGDVFIRVWTCFFLPWALPCSISPSKVSAGCQLATLLGCSVLSPLCMHFIYP